MSGLMLKDILVNKKYLYQAFGVIVLYIIIFGFMSNNFGFVIPFVILFFTMFILTTFQSDEAADWEMYCITLPTARKEIVQAKYMLALLLTLLGTFITILTSLLEAVMKKQNITVDILYLSIGFLSASLIYNSIQIPFTIKLGAEKARYAIFSIIFVPALLVLGLYNMGLINNLVELLETLEKNKNLLILAVFITGLLSLIASMRISIMLFQKKEF
ncbi:MAG: transport system permease protein [Anaerocolumna sp.]|nr:transport system permease protein [Anaerocolumna sp.]